ncbi:MAG: aminopeptidase P family protein [Eubacterium sp.]|nr:aminopeptidase P family protein [Eubacterium sp.]
MCEVKTRIEALRGEMRKRNMSVYIVPTADFHESEYVNDYFKARRYLTGFTGSAGVAVVTLEEAGLWTDGRYFIQAERQLEGSGITLFKSGMEDVPTVREFVREHLASGTALGFDGRVMNAEAGAFYEALCNEKSAVLSCDEDLVDIIWIDRPAFPANPAFILDERYAGECASDKLARVREKMAEAGADWHVLSSLCDIAWLLNVRGSDITSVPVSLSFVLMNATDCYWYVNPEIFAEIREDAKPIARRFAALLPEGSRDWAPYLKQHGVTLRDYDRIYEDLAALPEDETILLELGKINTKMKVSLPSNMKVVDQSNPEERMRAIKNPVELENIRKAHIKDGIACTKFAYWLKKNVGKMEITEWSAAEYLQQLRAEQPGYVDDSFGTISAYGANAAMMHYSPSKDKKVALNPAKMLLVDSGGHYLEGSTDITRNIVLGEVSEEEKRMYTAVVRGNLNLANARFLYGCCGQNLDILARGPLWDLGVDYRCGTGHGNGYLLNVHEGPNGFRWKIVPERRDSGILEEGMVTTNEPGVYVEGAYGIRIENELICKKGIKNEYGQFMEFETITFAPIDLDALLPEEMTARERKLLNTYHKKVYEVISPYLNEEECQWLASETREI